MLSAREINSDSLQNRTWVNERLTYTHGYGLTLGPVNQVTSQGLPVLFVRDLPPVTSAGLQITEPSIYFGELSNDYVIVRTNVREFHYPTADGDESTRYAGRGGVPIGSLWRKLLFALRFASTDIILSDDITSESRILFNRRISERVEALAGDFLAVRSRSVPGARRRAPATGSTTPTPRAAAIPIQRAPEIASTTSATRSRSSSTPITARRRPTWRTTRTRLPRPTRGSFRDCSSRCRRCRRPSAGTCGIRKTSSPFSRQVFATYHMTQPAMFYNREDQWEIPVIDESVEGGGAAMQPYYTIMRLPGEQNAEFIQMLPFTPRRKDNLAAWLVARSDGEHYGQLQVFEFPKQSQVYGPKQIVGRISQDQTISPQITLWNQQGSQVIWGTMMVIPIEESLIYVRPLYLRAQGGRIPELTRVIVAYEDRIVMEPTLEASLARLFGGQAPPPAAGVETTRTTATPAAPGDSDRRRRAGHRRPGADGGSARALRPGHRRAARRRLGTLRRGDQAAGRGARR